MKKKMRKYKHFRFLLVGLVLTAIIALGVSIVLGFVFYFHGKTLPNTYVLDTKVGGLDYSDFMSRIVSDYPVPQKMVFIYSVDDQESKYEVPLGAVDFSYDYNQAWEEVYTKGRTGNLARDTWEVAKLLFSKESVSLPYKYDEGKMDDALGVIAGEASVDAVYPEATFTNGEVLINKGSSGQEVSVEELLQKLLERLSQYNIQTIEISPQVIDPTISDSEAQLLKTRAEALIDKKLIIKFEREEAVYDKSELVTLLAPKDNFYHDKVGEVVNSLSKKFDRDPQNPSFIFENGRVQEFAPSKPGVKVKSAELQQKIENGLNELLNTEVDEFSVDLPVELTKSEFNTADVNNLGIKELIGVGVSRYRGSIASRVYNISLAASRLNGVLIKPGQVFSFNAALGDISKLTGYKEAYVIQDGKTILGDGGGVCQVSTTFFRAALDAGLPIVERRAHTYRVGYYEQGFPPGLDATIYSPTTDLKVLNDTPGHILIQATADPATATLRFELYGTSDGRVATTTKPVITDSVAPPDDLYIDDPTLPSGQIKQVEWKAWGSKVVFNYSVERAGETIYEKTFYSNYKPWGAVFMRGTAPVN